jgi:hypothetical protein
LIIDRADRFQDAKQMASYLRLVTLAESGGQRRRGRRRIGPPRKTNSRRSAPMATTAVFLAAVFVPISAMSAPCLELPLFANH